MKVIKFIFLLSFLCCLVFISCGKGEDETGQSSDDFDRAEMLEDWSDLIIIPAMEAYVSALGELETSFENFRQVPSIQTLEDIRASYFSAYKKWQQVSMFDIGKAEEIAQRSYSNVFPCDVSLLESNITSGNANLELPSNYAAQGFPALDYLLYGLVSNDEELYQQLSSDAYDLALENLISRLSSIAIAVEQDWKSGYRETFINNDGASGTASVDKLVNDFLFYYEKFLRAGKIGIPAGVFSGNPLPTHPESVYSQKYSKELFLEAMTALSNFFVGKNYDETVDGTSLYDYLVHLGDQQLADDILAQFTLASNMAVNLNDDFQEQINTDNFALLKVYDELQKAVVLLKVDMMQALNIQVDYVDADGD